MDRKAERAAATRHRIERAALKHFVERGVAGTKVRHIADTAGIVPAAIYVHFDDMDDLARSLFIGGWTEMGRGLRERTRADRGLAARLSSMIEYVFRRFDDDSLLVTYVFTSRHQHLRWIPPSRDNPYMIFRYVIADAMGRNEIPGGDLELKTSLVIGAIIQTIDSKILDRIEGKLEHHAKAAAAACLNMLRGGND